MVSDDEMKKWEEKYPFLRKMMNGPVVKTEKVIETVINQEILEMRTHSKTSYEGQEVAYKEELYLEHPRNGSNFILIPDIANIYRGLLTWCVKGRDVNMLGLEHVIISSLYDYHDEPFYSGYDCLREEPQLIKDEVCDPDFIVIRERKFDAGSYIIARRS